MPGSVHQSVHLLAVMPMQDVVVAGSTWMYVEHLIVSTINRRQWGVLTYFNLEQKITPEGKQ